MLFGEPFGGVIPGAYGAVLSTLLRAGVSMTGREVHRLLRDDHSLWSVQQSLNSLRALGIVQGETVGRATLHHINEAHRAVAPLRALADPVAALVECVSSAVGDEVEAVILFGSVARGEAQQDSDIDLAVIAGPQWDDRAQLADAVARCLGNHCDVVVFTGEQFASLAADDEPVIRAILADGVAIVGDMPRLQVPDHEAERPTVSKVLERTGRRAENVPVSSVELVREARREREEHLDGLTR